MRRLSAGIPACAYELASQQEMSPHPEWLNALALFSLGLAFLCALLITVDVFRYPQKMGIMNLVWPITALYFGPLAVWAYFKTGVMSTKQHQEEMFRKGPQLVKRGKDELKSEPPTRTQVALGVSHCGAGCTLGDIAGEWWIAAMGLTFAGGVLQTRLLLDFILAWVFGVAFQYFTIVPMRGLSAGKGIVAAIKADTISIVAFQIGMSIWAVLTYFVFFPVPHLHPTEAVFWFMMQIGMIIGFFTAYPANRWLLRRGLKERMPESPDAAHALDKVA